MKNKKINKIKYIVFVWILVLQCFLLSACGKTEATGNEQQTAKRNSQETQNKETDDDLQEKDQGEYDITLAFAGDIKFDDNEGNMQYYHQQGDDITKCISPDLITEMKNADIMWMNNEFTYSTRGNPLPGKAYTFRANPSRVQLLKVLGVDIVGLANNHVYDYGMDAFTDTLDTLKEAGIPYTGAGHDLEEAMEPVYMKVGDKTIAYVAASRAEKNKMTPQATETEGGILRCYDPEIFKEAIANAKEHADYVIALPHWGTEYSTTLENAQIETAKEYLDVGADAVVGAHTHCIQGMEYYNGKPIVYSLGNFWFNEKTLDTMILEIHLTGNDKESHVQVQMIPAIQSGYQTKRVNTPEEQQRIYRYVESISTGIKITDDGYVMDEK